MTRARLITAVFAALVLAACNDNSLPPGGTYQSVQGLVVDAATNQPIAGAIVTVETVLTATTDANGKFTIAQVPVGAIDYEVSVPNSKYQLYRSSANVAPDKPLSLTIALTH